jgi:Flp pilus assembly protein TadG
VGYSAGLFSLTDAVGTYNPRTVYQLTHPTIADLIHYVDDGPALTGAYKVITYVGNVFVKTITWYTDSTQAKRIVDRTLSYPSGSYATVTTDVWRVYAADGVTVAHTASDQIVSQGVLEISRTRTYA